MAQTANTIMEDDAPHQGGVAIRNAERTTDAVRDLGIIGGGTGQALSAVKFRKINVVFDWEFMYEIGIQTSIEQNYNTGQPGAVISAVVVYPRWFIAVHYVDKDNKPWVSFQLHSANLIDETPIGHLSLSERDVSDELGDQWKWLIRSSERRTGN